MTRCTLIPCPVSSPRGLCAAILLLLCLMAPGCAKKQPIQPPSPSAALEKKLDVVAAARATIGVPYKFGGNSPTTGFDCSGLVCWSYQQVGITLPRTARDQIMFGIKVDKREDLKPGDIVAFKGTRSRTGWHSGIYTGDGKFIHSPNSGKTVTEESMDSAYFTRRFAGARRIPRDGSAATLYAQYEEQQKAAGSAKKQVRKSRKTTLVAAKSTKKAASSAKKRNASQTKTKKTTSKSDKKSTKTARS